MFHNLERLANERITSYQQEAEIMRQLPREGVRHRAAMALRRLADTLEPFPNRQLTGRA